MIIGEGVVGLMAAHFPLLKSASSKLILVIHIVANLVVHFIIGCKYTPGYSSFMVKFRRWPDAIFYWIICGICFFSHVANIGVVNSPDRFGYTTFVSITCVNVVSCSLLLLFIRTTKFNVGENASPRVTEFGAMVMSVLGIIMGIFQLVCNVALHFNPDHMKEVIEGTGWTKGEAISLVLRASQLFSVVIVPLMFFSGKAVYGERFSVMGKGLKDNVSFFSVHVLSWMFYILLLLSISIYLCTDHFLAASAVTVNLVMSVWCMSFSLRVCGNAIEEEEKSGEEEDGAKEEGQPSPFANANLEEYDPNEETLGAISKDNIKSVLNGEMMIAYSLFLVNLLLRVTVDLADLSIWGKSELPIMHMIIVAWACFICCVPIAHISGRDKGVKSFHPFQGSGTFLAMQVFGWMLYTACVLYLIFVSVLTFSSTSGNSIADRLRAVPMSASLVGIVQAVPLIVITLSIVFETQKRQRLMRMQAMAVESFEHLRNITREQIENLTDPNEKRILQLAFRTMMEPALNFYELPLKKKSLILYANPASPNSPELDSESDEETEATKRQRRESTTFIVFFMCVASALFYVVASFFSQMTVLTLGFATCGVILMTASCVLLNTFYGPLTHPPRRGRRQYQPFMPFRGGSKFVIRQIIGWTCYAGAVLVTLISAIEAAGISPYAMVFAAVLSVLSQLFILQSIPFFDSNPKKPTYLEENGEGIVALLLFVGAFAFGHLYELASEFFSTDDSQPSTFYSLVGEKRKTRVPFVMTLIGIMLALPCVMLALNRTTKHWEKVTERQLRRKRRESHKEVNFDDKVAEQKPFVDITIPAMIIKNTLEITSMLLGLVIPLTTFGVVYVVTQNYTPKLMGSLESMLPILFKSLLGMLFLSVIPYFINVKVPRAFITIRYTLVTWCQYGMAVIVGTTLILPAFTYPCIGTRFMCFFTLTITILGGYKGVRLLLRLSIHALVGYRSYMEYQSYSKGNWSYSHLPSYFLDLFLTLSWCFYLPTYEHAPQLSGARRSMWFTNFARRYLFSDLTTYFNFKIIVDDPTVEMGTDTTKYLFSFHPHGVFPGTALFCSLTEAWKEKVGINPGHYVSTHVASIIFNVPVIRDYNLLLGCLSVSRRGIEASLKRGNSVLVVTGGQAEMLHTKISKEEMILVTHHKGFIRLAIANKVPLVPLLSMAENNLLGLIHFPRIQRISLKLLGFPFPMVPHGRFGLPLPYNSPLTLIVGKPIPIPRGSEPR
ncbi:diacylglycerol acyltransferase [Angomonas deanei]|uniref:Diacylglycerol acyltransferase, putative n=1 Tax=Angomonas deanei TaxID=59799 RepID=A0A7G2C6N7_9TRYP|nr:diacylglycerol acyltransferase [Angomonas deanei]CAD2215450.1 Diacylglycerol acyltransferase, putative [Angomonas deanei]|eukprot:EPY33493.1 diacylglycerol acyltransferase [Angomonas deanei]